MSLSRAQLLASATALCNAFASQAPVDDILAHFSSTHAVSAREHGLPLLAPFLGRPFSGLRGGPSSVEAYFKLLQKYLRYEDMSFGEWIVDTEARKVSCKGKAKFVWTEGVGDGQSWDEQFAYFLDFDQDGKVTDYQVFADSGAAYLAWTGRLKEKQKFMPKSVDGAVALQETLASLADAALDIPPPTLNPSRWCTKRTRKVGVTGKYGVRYGASLRKQVKKMEITQHARYTCTFCGKDSVKRQAVGIWHCKSCKKVVAGGAWTVSTTAAATVRSTVRRLREITEA
ncbi:60S ribosomal protein L43 [Steccherinum ochraceum]|uniref:60S ribosomal protein L43 n=1 Tax=Steccherinum ochraceum TaxID=92696 RepID=A0A4R0S2M1_9APHY|nr:60S ribosomal protein L43 [Steccherinum ochraceum]